MIYGERLQRAINQAIQTHAIDEVQVRKGKGTPYISHPLTVALILSRATDDEDLVIAGVLHDTLEDSPPHARVTRERLERDFGERVAALVDSVTEQDKSQDWVTRKRVALEHIGHMGSDEVLLKSADVLANTRELLGDFSRRGADIFDAFNANADSLLGNAISVIEALLARYPESPLGADLSAALHDLRGVQRSVVGD